MKVTIIGSGIMGLFSAYYLSGKGAEVTIIEKEKGPGGASLGNAGMIVPSHFTPLPAPGVLTQALKWAFTKDSPFALKFQPSLDFIDWGLEFIKASRSKDIKARQEYLLQLNLNSKALYEDLIKKENIDFGYRPEGLLMLCKDKKVYDHEKETAERSHELGMEAIILNRHECEEKSGGMEIDVLGGVYYPNDASLTPHLLLQKLTEILKSRNVQFIYHANDIHFTVRKGKVTEIKAGNTIMEEPGAVVLSAGMGTVELGKKLGIKIPLVSGKGYSITMKNPPKTPKICGIMTEARVAYTPMEHGLRFGGTMELGGKQGTIDQHRLEGIYKNIPKYFPQFQKARFSAEEVWSGLRPCTPSGLPVIEKTKSHQNVYICTGHAMMGLSLGAVSGKIISEMVR